MVLPTSARTDPPLPLVLALDAAEGVEGVEVLSTWTQDNDGLWRLRVRVRAETRPESDIPGSSAWYVHVDDAYPWGVLCVRPAAGEGIEGTYPHQLYNGKIEGEPFRSGDICTTSTGTIPGHRLISSPEPFSAEGRLAWHLHRTRRWLQAASRGELVQPGDRFELPEFPAVDGTTVVWAETAESLRVWAETPGRWGFLDAKYIGAENGAHLLVQRFSTSSGDLVYEPTWGTALTGEGEESKLVRGIWLRLDDVPALPPYQAPATWGDLRRTDAAQRVALDATLKAIVPHLEPSGPQLLLIGFPIPNRVGGEARSMHWQPASLPSVHAIVAPRNIRSPRARRQLQHHHTHAALFGTAKPLPWMTTQNWADDQLVLRGQLESAASRCRVLLLGAGALGSTIGELLVRCGCRDVVVMDGERLEAGNLNRHALTLANIGDNKAIALAAKLNQTAAHANVRAVPTHFTLSDPYAVAELAAAEVVIDCAASDRLLVDLQCVEAPGERLYVTMALGFEARKLIAFATRADRFPADHYREWVRPHIEEANAALVTSELPVGTGCFHPLFPARWDRIVTLAGYGIETLERWMAAPALSPVGLVVTREHDGLTGEEVEVP